MFRLFVLILVCCICLITLNSQSVYETSWKKELPFIGAGVFTLGAGAHLSTLPPLFTPDELTSLDPNDINRIDRFAIGNFSTTADRQSDVFWIGSHLTPLLFLTEKQGRNQFGKISIMFGEVVAINAGLTSMAKSIFPRPRPFAFNTEVSDELKLRRNAKTAFFSGHTSMAAANTFFAAKVFSDLYPDSNWKPIVWGAAITIPAITGYLRVEAGKHYPTDIIAGYAVGATIGYLVPHLHRNKQYGNQSIRLDMGYNSAHLTWKLNK